MNEVSKRQRVSCTRCVNGICVRCFRTIATAANKTDIECPYCKVAFSAGHVESQLTRVQITTRRVNVRIKLEYDYIQVTYDNITHMSNLSDLMSSLHDLHVQIANVRMKLFPFAFMHPNDTSPSRADIGASNRLKGDLSQLNLRATCISEHIAHIINTSNLPEDLIGDCVSNAFETCYETTGLSAYAKTPDLKEMVEIGLLLYSRHVVRPNAFQYAKVRIDNMRSRQTVETWQRELVKKCKPAIMLVDWFGEMSVAIEDDALNETNTIIDVLDKIARKTKAPKDLRTWFLLYRRWRIESSANVS